MNGPAILLSEVGFSSAFILAPFGFFTLDRGPRGFIPVRVYIIGRALPPSLYLIEVMCSQRTLLAFHFIDAVLQ